MLSDCISKNRDQAELFLVSGRNYSSAKEARDRFTQAVLGIRNGLPDVTDLPLDRVLDSEDVKSIIAAIGAGIVLSHEMPDLFDLRHLRYGKIIFAFGSTEPEEELLKRILILFEQYFYPLFDHGHLYLSGVTAEPGISAEEFENRVMDPQLRKLILLNKKGWREQLVDRSTRRP